MRAFPALFLILTSCVNMSAAELAWPVDASSPLETVAAEFQMCDGPSWDGSGSLYIPDVKAGKLFRYRPATKKLELMSDAVGRISATYFNHGKLYLADNGESGIALWQQGKKVRLAGHDPAAKPPIRPNDLTVDNAGGVYYTLTGQGQVMYVAADGSQSVAVAGIDTPNGLILSPDEQTLYVASYAPKKISAYAVDAPGKTSAGRLFATMDDGPDKGADGMTVDRAGNVYCAGAKHVWIWDPAGRLLTKLETPTRPINCAFGDSDEHTLYITGLGGLYKQRMHITGRPPQPPMSEADQPTAGERLKTTVPEGVTPHLDVVYARYGSRSLLADIFVPADRPGPLPAVVIVHGGGWQNGDKTKFRTLAIALAERGYVTAAIEYRLSEDKLFPAAIQDCNAAVRFLRANAAKYQVDTKRIGAVGGSAGAHLVGLMAAAPLVAEFQGSGGNAEQSSAIQAAVAMAGPMQLDVGPVAERSRKAPAGTGKFFSVIFLGKTIDEAPELYKQASPYNYFGSDTPPLLFQTGALDNPERDQPSLERLKLLGVWTDQKIYADGKHGCWNQPGWFPAMLADVDAFFREHLK